jgi:hypothetical protein
MLPLGPPAGGLRAQGRHSGRAPAGRLTRARRRYANFSLRRVNGAPGSALPGQTQDLALRLHVAARRPSPVLTLGHGRLGLGLGPIGQIEHRDRRNVGDLLATAANHPAIGQIDVEQHRIEALVPEAPERVGHADHLHDFDRRHDLRHGPRQPGQLAALGADQQKAERLVVGLRARGGSGMTKGGIRQGNCWHDRTPRKVGARRTFGFYQLGVKLQSPRGSFFAR